MSLEASTSTDSESASQHKLAAIAFMKRTLPPLSGERPPDPSDVRTASFISAESFLAGHSRFQRTVKLAPFAEPDVVMTYIGISGSARVEAGDDTVVATDTNIVVSATRTVKTLVLEAGREEVVIIVGADAVRQRISQFVGFDVYAPLDFHIVIDGRSPLGSSLVGFGGALQSAIAGDTLLRSSPIGLRRCKDSFIDLMLSAIGMEAVLRIAGTPLKASLAQVKRAEEFMRQHGHEPIGIGEVADFVGVSVRSLQYAFRQHRDTTPLAVLQRIRLEGLRDELRGNTHAAIARVAARWGFTNLGRMGRQYRAAFGEKPSETVFRALRRG